MNEFKSQREYKVVTDIIKELADSNRIAHFQGKCVAACDILQALFDAKGLRAKTFECTLVVVNGRNKPGSVAFVGFDSIEEVRAGDLDTHVVILVEAETPFIVDASVGNIVGNDKYVIVTPLSNKDPDVIADSVVNGVQLVYRVKKNIRLFSVHQKNLLDKIIEDQKIKKDVGLLSWMVRILIGVGVFNMIANSWLVILKFMYP